MPNILNYAESFTLSFQKSPFNSVDGLILSWLSYFTYPDILKSGKAVKLKDLGGVLLPDKQTYAQAFNPKKSKKLFNLLSKNPRFMQAEFSDYAEENDEKTEKQFAAITIKLSENEYFLSFRGTDPSFTGWKEDFNLALCAPVPSQLAAAEYFKAALCRRPDGKFYLGGHSKGGNVAVYAAAVTDESAQQSVINVFNFDGPALLCDLYSERGYKNVAGKIIKIIPAASFVGMMFETRKSFCVIKSKRISFLQHDPFCWIVKGGGFVKAVRRTHFSVRVERAFNRWVAELSLADRERMINLLYQALCTLDTKTLTYFLKPFTGRCPRCTGTTAALNPMTEIFSIRR